jgi:hypothetical protein
MLTQMTKRQADGIVKSVIKTCGDIDALKPVAYCWLCAASMKRIESLVIALMEEVVAEKVVNKFVTEMGTDMKKLFENAAIRDDIRFYMRKNIEKMLDAIKERGDGNA